MQSRVYARHGREPFGSELKAEGLMGYCAFVKSYGEAGSPLYVNPILSPQIQTPIAFIPGLEYQTRMLFLFSLSMQIARELKWRVPLQ